MSLRSVLSLSLSLSLSPLGRLGDRVNSALHVKLDQVKRRAAVECQTHTNSGCDRRREREREESSLGNLVTAGLERRSHRVSGAQAAATGISRK